jgi:hypothetical protein
MILRWPSGSSGLPIWWPRGKLTKTARGGFTALVISRAEETEMVGMPASSMARANSPTDWWHSCQTGTRKAASTSISRSRPMR